MSEQIETLPPDEIETCVSCGKRIVTQHFYPGGIESEFISDDGQCFNCENKRRKSKVVRSLPEIKEENKMARKKKTKVDERDPAVVAAQKAQESENGNGAEPDPDEPSNRKSIGYEVCPAEVYDLMEDAMTRWHVELVEARVEIKPLFASAYNKHGEAIPAIKVRGHAAIAKIKITKLEDRVRGMGDATLLIDGARWERMGHNARLAMLDHQLEHLQVDEEKLDDAGRPKLKMKHHDWELSGFDEVMKRQGENSIELQNVALLKELFAQLLIPFPDQPQSAKLERIPPELLS